ncbi:unnamed protein product [Adineta ricciae]|uniref:RRM domain-containing protein n=1 Tax=Adineta ricciae TaxID=249248 RepID=A0A813PHJ6_ADIRI|nr:unnamed protein product [Adineta ricciae]
MNQSERIIPLPCLPTYIARRPVRSQSACKHTVNGYNPIFSRNWEKAYLNHTTYYHNYVHSPFINIELDQNQITSKQYDTYRPHYRPRVEINLTDSYNRIRPLTVPHHTTRTSEKWSRFLDGYTDRFKIDYPTPDNENHFYVSSRPGRFPSTISLCLTYHFPFFPILLERIMSLLHKDTTFTKIFVGGLPYHTTDETLRKFFERFGEIEEAVVITDRQTGKSRGYGFVTMGTQEAANLATREANPVIDGRKANVNLAYLGAKPRVIPTPTGLFPLHLAGAYSTALPTTYGIQPIYYQQPSTAALLATATTPQTLSTIISNQNTATSTTALTGGMHTAPNQATGTPSYYELTYTTTPTIEPSSYIYATTSGQSFSYAQIPTPAAQSSTGPTNLNDVYGNHTGKYIIDDHLGSVDHEHHSRAASGW